MNPGQFDDLTRALALSGSRRAFLLHAAGAISAGFFGRLNWRGALGWPVRPPCRSDADCGPCEKCLTTNGLCLSDCGKSREFRCCPGRGRGGFRCAYLRTERENCGACGLACEAGETCCRGTCRNLQTDRENCGACERSCGPQGRCCDGACRTGKQGCCPEGKKRCGDKCIPADGTCCITRSGLAHGCGPKETCCYSPDGTTGTCTPPGETCCPDGCSHSMEDPHYYTCCLPAAVGGIVEGCWKADGLCDCGDGLECCPEQRICVHKSQYLTDPSNCGGCGRKCRACETCVGGKCVCEGPRCGKTCCCEKQQCREGTCCEPCGAICCAGNGPTPNCCFGKCLPAGESCCLEGQVPGCRAGHCCEAGEECCPRAFTGCVPIGSPCPPTRELSPADQSALDCTKMVRRKGRPGRVK